MKLLKPGFLIPAVLILISSLYFAGCEKDDDNSSPLQPTGSTLRTTVVGKITDTDGLVVIGAAVKMGSHTTVTNGRGYFFFTNTDVPKDRMVFIATKSGYFNCVRATRTQNNSANYVNLVMQVLPTAVGINGTNGGVVTLAGGATITFPQNAFVDKNGNAYTGMVKVFARHFNPADPGFEAIVPGGDLVGTTTTGQTQILYSLGMIETLLKDNAGLDEIKLAPGKTAELKMPIDPSQSASALATIPLWYLKESTAKWVEEGQATKVGNFYIGTVTHFSTWNCDYGGPRTDIKGKVVDCNNDPVAGCVVTVNGFLNVTTDNLGSFTTWVPVGYVIECQVLMANNPNITGNSPIQSITAVAGVINIIPTLVVPCATRLIGTVLQCGSVAGAEAYIYGTWNGGSTCVFTSTGNYKLMAPPGTEVNITASFGGMAGTTKATTGPMGTIENAPSVQLCNALPVMQNRFAIVNGGNTTAYVLSGVQSITDFIDINSDGVFENANITITGIANPGAYNCSIFMELDYEDGSEFPLHMSYPNPSHMTIGMDSIGVWSYESGLSAATTTDNMINVIDFGTPGGVMSGTFEFDAPNGKIQNGEFSIIRYD